MTRRNNVKNLLGKGGKGDDVEGSLENSRFLTDAERDKYFPPFDYSDMSKVKKDGIPVRAVRMRLPGSGRNLRRTQFLQPWSVWVPLLNMLCTSEILRWMLRQPAMQEWTVYW